MAHVTKKDFASGATMTTIDHGKFITHSYQAPADEFGNTSHIIETPCKVIIIDSQYMVPYAKELRSIADSLQKEIVGIIISHAHPDHYLGLGAAFTDIPVWSIKSVQDDIRKNGQHMLAESLQNLSPELLADKIIVPDKIICPGNMTIDGLHITYLMVQKGEAKTQLVIKLHQIKTIIVQDLVYNGFHPWLSKYIYHWQKIIAMLEDCKYYKIVLVGHGPPAKHDIFCQMQQYLNKAIELAKSTSSFEVFKAGLIAAYPNLKAVGVIDMYHEYVFPNF